jgi:hypothetical protein
MVQSHLPAPSQRAFEPKYIRSSSLLPSTLAQTLRKTMEKPYLGLKKMVMNPKNHFIININTWLFGGAFANKKKLCAFWIGGPGTGRSFGEDFPSPY